MVRICGKLYKIILFIEYGLAKRFIKGFNVNGVNPKVKVLGIWPKEEIGFIRELKL